MLSFLLSASKWHGVLLPGECVAPEPSVCQPSQNAESESESESESERGECVASVPFVKISSLSGRVFSRLDY
jgi:hypothetical protein